MGGQQDTADSVKGKPKVVIRYGKVIIDGEEQSSYGSDDSVKQSSNKISTQSDDSGFSDMILPQKPAQEESRNVLNDFEERQRKVSSLYNTKESGLDGSKKKFFQVYYPVGDTSTVLLQSIYLSRHRGYLAGNLLEIDKLPRFRDGGPTFVRLHLTILPCKKHILKTMWVETLKEGRVKINEYYKYDLDQKNKGVEKQLRVRAYGTRNPDVSYGAKCVGECVVDIDQIEKERGGLNFWISLTRDKR